METGKSVEVGISCRLLERGLPRTFLRLVSASIKGDASIEERYPGRHHGMPDTAAPVSVTVTHNEGRYLSTDEGPSSLEGKLSDDMFQENIQAFPNIVLRPNAATKKTLMCHL